MATPRPAVLPGAVLSALLAVTGSLTAAPPAVADTTAAHVAVPGQGVAVNITTCPTTLYQVPSVIQNQAVLIPAPVRAPAQPAPAGGGARRPTDRETDSAWALPQETPVRSAPVLERPAPDSAPEPAPGGENLSGLPWKSGVYSHDPEKTARYEQALGRQVDVVNVFVTRDSWHTMLDPWWLNVAPAGYDGALEVAVPLWPGDESLDATAAGRRNAHWEHLGCMLEERYPGSSVRIGWEFNLKGWHHGVSEDNLSSWIDGFRHASTSLKQGGPSLQVVWGPNGRVSDGLADATRAWPGDEYVDVVALSYYDWFPPLDTPQKARQKFAEPHDLNFWIDFARRHGKRFALSEAGVAPGNSHGGGDNPVYIDEVLGRLRDVEAEDPGRIDSVVYFDEPAPFLRNSIAGGQVPRTAAALREQLDEADLQFDGSGPRRSTPTLTPGPAESPPPGPQTPSPGPATPTEEWVIPDGADHGPVPGG